ncbi:molybdenum cofactor guanylyltransferase [Phocicoccus pinnipedialis]|uniref:Putative molybdenum cofactor guanylyltransferase n=1 Tax=Phocicoccus pinnipedialis TaxID=110845 RepID=A0A6V7QZZ4_9BACL|nr:molybdenum cofactor guanylyltransferase [Jeotgalicoccus pinnipedialis]MBP1938747.1 molybdopterin-guanine dinucleotide biosynthesis protein A [Jeotgalicoccus pinnipedialis]CAD2070619.1 putative molybdenum cofactor guanylyltransferase [Jeotgalicoccus pinnipedialis]
MIGVILAGGNSTRFGEDKSLYNLDGAAMYKHVASNLINSGVCDKIVISTNERLKSEFSEYETIIDEDRYRDHGPLSGIYSVAKRYVGHPLLVVSTDTPYVPSVWLQILSDIYKKNGKTVVTKGKQLHPLVGIYHDPNLAMILEDQLNSKQLSIRQFLNKLDYMILDIEAEQLSESDFKNINHKSDI